MGFLAERMADAQFEIHTPTCLMCKNVERHKFNNNRPLDPIITCKVLGAIPRDLDSVKTFECDCFDPDKGEIEINRGLLPPEQLEYVNSK